MGLFKKQGGQTFAGSLLAVTFERTDWNNTPAAKKAGSKPYSTISAKLTIDKDGAEKPIEQFLEAGFLYPDRGQGISEDGSTLEGGAGVGEGTEFALFVQSAIDQGFDEALLVDEAGNGTNFSALAGEGNRYEFGRAINEPRQMASGAKALGIKDTKTTDGNGNYVGKAGKTYTKAEVMTAGKKQDKNDKSVFYNQTYIVVEAILGAAAAEAPAAKAAPAPAKTTAKTVAAKGRTNGKAVEVEVDYETADALLIDALGNAKNGSLKKASLSSVVVKWAVENDKSNEERDAIRALFSDDAYLGRANGWKFDGDAKDKPVSLA